MTDSGTATTLEQNYQEVLRHYLHDRDEAHLNDAYEIGREALNSGYGLISLVGIHYTTLVSALREDEKTAPVADLASAAGRILQETTAPFSVLHIDSAESTAALRRLNGLFEEASNRIAHSLHDEATQLLGVVYLELALLRSDVPESIRQRVDRITQYLDQTCEQLRQLSHELRPPMLEQLGLVPSLHHLISGMARRHELDIALKEPTTEKRLPGEVELILYRAVQEGLRNIVRHAHAKHASVTLSISGHAAICSIRDDGQGFDTDAAATPEAIAEAGLGLMGIRERAGVLGGTVKVESALGRGTELRISIPLGD